LIESISFEFVLSSYYKNSYEVIIYNYDPRQMNKFLRNLEDSYDLKLRGGFKQGDIVKFSRSINNLNLRDVEREMQRYGFQYVIT